MRRNTERMLALVEDLMLVGRLQTGDLEPRRTAVDLPALITEAAELLASREPYTDATVRADSGPALSADGPLLRDLLYAVIGTVASGAADRSATVQASAGRQGWTVRVTARQSEQLTDEQLMAGMLALPEPPHRRRSTAVWMLLAEAIAAAHGGSVRLTYTPEAGGRCRDRASAHHPHRLTALPVDTL
nr:hypothetical protein GCM10020092_008290 [Actinoplanes digitatis]